MSITRLLAAAAGGAALMAGLWGPAFSVDLHWLLLGARLGIDDVSRPFLVVTGLAWLTAGLLINEPELGRRRGRFLAMFWLALAGNLLTVLSQDIVSFYTAFAVMSLAAYGLVAHPGGPRSRFAGRVYIVLAVAGELLLFAAMVGLVHAAGGRAGFPLEPGAPLAGWLTLCVLAGFGIKAGLVPLHVSLPLIYRAAPLAAGVALAGAALNAGILGWLRWLPVADAGAWSGMVLVVLGAGGYLYAVAAGLCQRHPRALLGYSSVSQVALMAVVIGVGLRVPEHWPALLPGVIAIMFHHAVAKTFLFAVSGLRPRVLAWTGVVVAGAGLAGVPLTAGYAAKSVLKDSVLLAPDTGQLADWLWLSSALTTLLVARFAWLLARFPGRTATSSDRLGIAASFTALALITVAAAARWQGSPGDLLTAAAPVVGALLLAVLIRQWLRHMRFVPGSRVRVPAGDLAVPIARWLRGLGTGLTGLAAALPLRRVSPSALARRAPGIPGWVDRSANTPEPVWSNAAGAVLACVVVIGICLVLVAA